MQGGLSTAPAHPLEGLSLFKGAREETLRALRGLRPGRRVLDAGAPVFEPEGVASDLFFLSRPQRGDDPAPAPLVSVDLAGDDGRRRLRLGRIVEGEFFGELEFVRAGLAASPGPRQTAARALTPALVWSLALSDLAGLLETDAVVRGRFLRVAVGRLLDTMAGQHGRALLDPEIVLADWLVELAADLGRPVGNRVAFAQKIAQPDIAAELGVARETVSRRLKEWERAGLVATGRQSQRLEILDYDRIIRIASLRDHKDASMLARAIEEIDHDIGCGNHLRARNLALDMLRHYPSSPHLVHRVALCAARGGDREEALAILERHGLLGRHDLGALRLRIERAAANPLMPSHRLGATEWVDDAFEDEQAAAELTSPAALAGLVEDIAALEARLLKDVAFAEEGASPDRDAALACWQVYDALYRFGGGHYAGVNAAAMALAAGQDEDGRRIARELVNRLSNSARDYWTQASLAEALLIVGERERAVAALAAAAAAPGASDGAKATTALQLYRLGPLLGFPAAEFVGHLRIGRVAVLCGHMFRGAEMDEAAQHAAEDALRRQADAILQREPYRYVYGSLASGSDIVLAEAALAAGARLHAVLPFAIDDFLRLSVDVGDPPGAAGRWRARFEEVMGQVASLTMMSDQRPLERDLDGYFHHGFRFIAGLALMHAATLQSEAALIAASDGIAPDNIAGANRALADWIGAGRPAHVVAFAGERRPVPERPRGASCFAPVLFLWPEEEARRSVAATAKERLPRGAVLVERRSKGGADGVSVIAASLEDAIDLAVSATTQASDVQAVADFGPVLGRDLAPDGDLLARLRAATQLSGFPRGRPLATQNFAAESAFVLGGQVRLVPVGRAEARDEERAEAAGPQPGRPRPGIPIYRLARR